MNGGGGDFELELTSETQPIVCPSRESELIRFLNDGNKSWGKCFDTQNTVTAVRGGAREMDLTSDSAQDDVTVELVHKVLG